MSAFLPEEVGKLKLGMTLDEYRKTFPSSRCAIGDSTLALYFIDIKSHHFWNSAACCFKNNTMNFLALIVIDTSENNVKERKNKIFNNIDTEACALIKKLLCEFGKIDKKFIILEEESADKVYYEPLLIWETDTYDVHLHFTSAKHVFDLKVPSISLAFSMKDEDVSDHYPKVLREDGISVKFDGNISEKILYDENVKFDDIISDAIKKVIGSFQFGWLF